MQTLKKPADREQARRLIEHIARSVFTDPDPVGVTADAKEPSIGLGSLEITEVGGAFQLWLGVEIAATDETARDVDVADLGLFETLREAIDGLFDAYAKVRVQDAAAALSDPP